MTLFITNDDLLSWLEDLARERTIIGPKSVANMVLYRPVTSSKEIVLNYQRPKLSPKEFLWPATEPIAILNPERTAITAPTMEREQVLFGLRPCDARGISVMDALLLAPPADALYADKRAKTTLVGIACPTMFVGCFCTSLGSSPDDARDLDILLHQIEGGYAVQVVTEKGKALLASARVIEKDVTVPKPITDAPLVPVLPVQEWAARFNDPYWARISERCISCRICTFVCPTCRCFDVRDITNADRSVERLRSWDACQLEAFCRIASGHNPRPTKLQRLRQRFYCKFSYVPQDFGPVACVGCGRCVVECPVNIDIREMLQDINAKSQ